MSPHPSPEVLALHARGDLPFFWNLRIRAHAARCAACEETVTLYHSVHDELKREAAAETLTAFEAVCDWDRLEREMLGNIAVGVSAARCIDKVVHKRSWLPKVAFTSALAALFAAGWFAHISPNETRLLASKVAGFSGFAAAPPVNMVRTTPTGIAVRSDGITLTILHPASAVVAVSGNSSVQARYVDEDTGQLTITSVYGQ